MDAIRLEVMWNRLISVVNEQAAALMRTSFTSIVREAGDLSAGVFDARGNMIAQAVTGTPGHINAMATCIHHFLAAYPAETLRPGDVLITNDPQKTSGHLHDFTVITPVFLDERLVGFFGNTCHVLDIGGIGLSTDARSVFEEGLFIPITKLFSRGEPNDELLKILAANVRTPEPVLGDIYAQAAGNDVGAARLVEFMTEFGLDTLEPLADEIIAVTGPDLAGLRSTVVLWVIWFGINFGYYGFVLWTPSLLLGRGFDLVRSFEFTLIMTLAQLPGYFSAAWLVERVGRKGVLSVYFAGTALAAWLFGHAATTTAVLVYGSLLYFFSLGAWGCVYAYTPEVYPTAARASGSGWASAFGRLGAFSAPFIVPVLYGAYGEQSGFTYVFIMLTGVFALVSLVVAVLGKETMGKSLEEISEGGPA